MEATLQLPEALARRLQELALQEGASLDGLIRMLIAEHAEIHHGTPQSNPLRQRTDIRLPLIPREETGLIQPVSGADLDDMFSHDDFAS